MSTLKIGWGKREISLNEPVNLFGQMELRISEGILDPLYATALCLDGGEGQDVVIFCALELEGIRCGIIGEIKEAVHGICPQIPLDAIIVNVTHTHTAGDITNTPDQTPDGAPMYPGRKYRAYVAKQAARAICEAWENRREGGIAYGYGYAVVSHSRRVVYLEDMSSISGAVAPNGRGVMYGNTTRDGFSHYEAGADHSLNALFTFNKNDELTGMVLNVPCPSQVIEFYNKMSADYWHDVRQLVEKEYGSQIYVLPQCAAAGDLSPRMLHYREAEARRMRLKYNMPYDVAAGRCYNDAMTKRYDIAERIVQGVKEIYSWAKSEIFRDPVVRHMSRSVPLSRRMITEEEKQWCEDNIEKMRSQIPEEGCGTPEEIRQAVSFYRSIKNRNQNILERYKRQHEQTRVTSDIHTVQVGEIAFTTTRFEMFMDYMHRIQARSPYIQTFVMQLAGEEGGDYLSTERGTLNKGYSASLFDNPVSYEGGQELVETTLDMLCEMKNI